MIASTLDPRAFRTALGAFPTGVTIITARGADGTPVGLTANSFNSVSLDPPLVLWSLSKKSSSRPVFEATEDWAVHILAADQQALSLRFAKSGEDKFAGVATETGVIKAPLLPGCASRLQCRTAFRHDAGDHIIFVGEVVAFDRNEAAPLAFHAGKYAIAARSTDHAEFSGPDLAPDPRFGEDFLGYLLWRAHIHFRLPFLAQADLEGLPVDVVLVSEMLLHHDGRSVEQLASGVLETGPSILETCIPALEDHGLVKTVVDEAGTPRVWLTERGRSFADRNHAVAQTIEADLLSRMEVADALAFKSLLRRFIISTGTGQPHPWQR